MLVSEIITLAQAQSRELYPDQDWIDYINMALDDLTPVAKMPGEKRNISVTPTNGEAVIDMSEDPDLAKVHEVLQVYYTPTAPAGPRMMLRRLGQHGISGAGWYLIGTDTLKLQGLTGTSGKVDVAYYRKLSHVTSPSDTPDLPAEYHYLLVLYAVTRAMEREMSLEDRNTIYSDYLAAKRQFAYDRIWAAEPHNRRRLLGPRHGQQQQA
jgi:hypothetical protein